MSDSAAEGGFRVDLPADLEAGVYANFLFVWHTAYEFTFDFCVAQPPEETGEEPPNIVPFRVVSRVRIPVTLVFDVLKAINASMTRYEDLYGEIQVPKPKEDE